MFSHQEIIFRENQVPTPEQIYLTAIGMFDAAGYTCEMVVTGRGKPFELARVYRRGTDQHILYFPGSDDDHNAATKPTTQLKIINTANAEIRRHFRMGESDLINNHKHYLIIDENISGHFIYGYSHRKAFQTAETLNNIRVNRMLYEFHGLDCLHPNLMRAQCWYRSISTMTQPWQSGHCLLQLFQKKMNPELGGAVYDYDSDMSTEPRLLDSHNKLFHLGAQIVSQRNPSVLYREGVISCVAQKAPIKKFKIQPSEVFKSLLKGLLIGLMIAAIITLLVYTFGGAAALIATAGVVGGACGFAGAGSSIAFGIGLFAGFMSVVTSAYSVIKNYQFNKKMYQNSLPLHRINCLQSKTNNADVFDGLGVTPETLNQVSHEDLQPPPPYTEEMALRRESNLQNLDNQSAVATSDSAPRPH